MKAIIPVEKNEKIFDEIDKMKEPYFKVWEDVCNIESPTGYKEGINKVGEYFAEMAKERGWKVEYFKQEASGDVVCITMNPESKQKPVALSGHIDTVHPVGMFGTPAVRREGTKIYGPGVVDCKGGVVAGFMSMDVLEKCGFNKCPVMLLLQTDEETNSKTSDGKTIDYICEKSKDSVIFLNLESFCPGQATLSRKGIVTYKFHIEGKEGHSSRCATEGANAVVDAAYKIIELNKLKDDDGITCNCAMVSGGTVVNTIPGKCEFSVNFRYVTNAQLDFIENIVSDLAKTEHVPGCKCTFEKTDSRPAMELNKKNKEMLQRVNQIFEEYGIPTLEGVMLRGGSDAANVTQCGIPCMDSLGIEGGGSHSINEYAELNSLSDAVKRIVAIVYNI